MSWLLSSPGSVFMIPICFSLDGYILTTVNFVISPSNSSSRFTAHGDSRPDRYLRGILNSFSMSSPNSAGSNRPSGVSNTGDSSSPALRTYIGCCSISSFSRSASDDLPPPTGPSRYRTCLRSSRPCAECLKYATNRSTASSIP